MKNRLGFVSNSSSSSYIIGEEIMDPLLRKAMEAVEEHETSRIPIKGIAYEMLKASERTKHLPHLDKIPDDVRLIVFQSCNYETEIMQLESGNAIILTCNNERDAWEDALESIEKRFSRSYRSIEETEDYDNIVYENPYYSAYEEKYEDLDDEYDVYHTFNVPEFAKNVGSVAYINENGIVLYEGENRTCIR